MQLQLMQSRPGYLFLSENVETADPLHTEVDQMPERPVTTVYTPSQMGHTPPRIANFEWASKIVARESFGDGISGLGVGNVSDLSLTKMHGSATLLFSRLRQ